jgi:hypothetical protein
MMNSAQRGGDIKEFRASVKPGCSSTFLQHLFQKLEKKKKSGHKSAHDRAGVKIRPSLPRILMLPSLLPLRKTISQCWFLTKQC